MWPSDTQAVPLPVSKYHFCSIRPIPSLRKWALFNHIYPNVVKCTYQDNADFRIILRFAANLFFKEIGK